MRSVRFVPLALLATVAVAADPPTAVKPKFTLGKETTFITEPLTADGYLDYETALNDRLRGKVTPDTNAVVGLLAATGPKPEGGELPDDFFKALGVNRPPADGDYWVSHFKFFTEELRGPDVNTFYDQEATLRAKPWKPADAPKHAEWLAKNEKPLAVAVKAAERPDYYHPLISRPKDGSPPTLIGALLPLPQKCREVAQALELRAMLRCGEGKFDSAWADVMTLHRLGRLIARGGGTGIEMLVGVALGAIAHNAEQAFIAAAKPDAKTALKCQADLLALPAWPNYADKIGLGERFTVLDTLQLLRRNGADVFQPRAPGDPKPTREQIDAVMGKLDWDAMFRLNNKWFDRIVAAAAKPTRAERVTAYAETNTALKSLFGGIPQVGDIAQLIEKAGEEKVRTAVSEQVAVVLLQLLTPAFEKLGDSIDRAEQYALHGVLAFALAAYRADHGTYPATLADLAPKYVRAVPDDLFSGKALVYEPSADGYRLYSVGANGTDDGGRSFGDDPKGDDLVLRVPRK